MLSHVNCGPATASHISSFPQLKFNLEVSGTNFSPNCTRELEKDLCNRGTYRVKGHEMN